VILPSSRYSSFKLLDGHLMDAVVNEIMDRCRRPWNGGTKHHFPNENS
jgi:hypothetical protein